MMTLDDLDAQTRELLIETCDGRVALATVLLTGIASAAAARAEGHLARATEQAAVQAAAQAVAAERERVAAHLALGEMAGLPLALAAICDGRSTVDVFADYLSAARARAEHPTLRLVQTTTGD